MGLTVGIVADEAVFEPEDMVRPKAGLELAGNLSDSRLAVAVGVEQHDLRGKDAAGAVALDGTALEDLGTMSSDQFAAVVEKSHG